MRRLILALGLVLAPAATLAQGVCEGRNLMAGLSRGVQAELRAAADAVPHSRGLFWRAEKGEAAMTLIGTYHFGDPRHDLAVERFAPVIAEAHSLLVEAGPEEERALTAALGSDPALMADITGPTLPERLEPEEWSRLSTAMAARGVPAVIASRMRPWYVATLLGLSPCMIEQATAGGDIGGLDQRLIDAARQAGTPVRALEPWDTLFSVFDSLTETDEIDMIRAALPAAEHADDYATTLIEAYFDQDVWMLWEFGRFDAYANSGLPREAVDRQLELAQRELMDRRNADWIAPLTEAAAEAAAAGQGIVAAFGALHLPGEAGVLALLEDEGWTVTRIE
ncbi:TraB/GumN family protein [Paracoccus sp. S-4012]|uniref:TraB/GumN family protein n=1 Tax=Paracoccus sp. S-4012 TaxID=2665648 RepID=UPI0012AF1ED4|nr:TraB/GumN family protein [Paracoccus sp. S-4012]MRX51775.1 TraB/GumN family protein [Paracoccus sp. S-4012]